MKRIIFVAAVTGLTIAATGPALAISRYQSSSLTCEGARQAIRSEGAVIIRYPSKRVGNMTLYDRYVVNSDFCDPNEYAERAYVPTSDSPRCPVLACEPKSNLDGLMFIPRHQL
ncbi:hypothetical protein [Rhizobium sp. RU36D]|uniref:hypothetical protein n=1 Tax=Rhizobium sp. RU36D TaxID=1907415 RepID=UPI0009D79C59|nr:hypothetical protein [Rhizobium sp. RU36D]SMD08524.1 hypothetical protein SAMN05880593_12030 [Rhizobium sp. RU36D]